MPNHADDILFEHADAPPAARRVARLARWLDAAFRIPGTNIRFGFDTLVGLIPVVGDSATALVGGWIVAEAWRAGARPATLLRMLANLVIDWFLGLIPGIDLIADTAFKANQRNAALLLRDLTRRPLRAPARPHPFHKVPGIQA